MSLPSVDQGCVLAVDDDAMILTSMAELLGDAGFEVTTAASAEEALDKLEQIEPDAVVTDLQMPGMDGITLLERLRKREVPPTVILVTAHGSIDTAVRAMRTGAEHFLTKPVSWELLEATLHRALRARALRGDVDQMRAELRERLGVGFGTLVGQSEPMKQVYRLVKKLAGVRTTVLVTGESGTGKGELARCLHQLGPRASGPFVEVHCAALPETLVESELFGHERGAFTGAAQRRAGRFEHAEGGTLFLDEVTEIPPATQVKLLRVLQEKTFERVGSSEPRQADVRLVAATNRDPAEAVRAGQLREDLYYRLHVAAVEMPPLRARGHDVLLLAEHFLHKHAESNEKRIIGFAEDARAALLAGDWPGNVRELSNLLERAVVLCQGTTIHAQHLAEPTSGAGDSRPVDIPGSEMDEIEQHAILSTLRAVQGSTAAAAEMLQISPRTIQNRLKRWGLARPRGRPRSHDQEKKS